jgi:molybdopterin synthase catalytic subunit/molybdopterin converting factor small subunit
VSDNKKVHVKFFAIFREYVGLKEDWTDVAPGTTVEQLWNRYAAQAKNPRVANIRAAYSVNQRLARPDTALQGGEEVGFLPPVSGGATAKAARASNRPRSSLKKRAARPAAKRAARVAAAPRPARSFIVTSNKLSLGALIKRVEHPSVGGIVTFSGVVRDNAHDRTVKFLEYEAYDELAERTLEQIGQETATRWPEVRLAIAHRTGHLEIGDASVLIAASSPHRAEAFAACRYAIERIKVILPVWKKEFASADEYWVEGPVAGEASPEQAEEVVRAAEAQ